MAIPSQAFGGVQRYLRQKRAGGQTVSKHEEGRAWQSYWDVMADRSIQQERLRLERARIEANIRTQQEQLKMQRKQMEQEEGAAKVAGITQLGTTAFLGAHVLKGTSLGAKMGLGAAPTAGVVGGQVTPGGVATVAPSGGGMSMGLAGPSTAQPTAITAAAPLLGPAIAGAGAGYAGSVLGEEFIGNDAGQVIGGLAGGAAMGAAIGGPPGAIVGGLIGGAIGAVGAIKD